MPDEQPTVDPSQQDREVERKVLYLLTEPEAQNLWEIEELEREVDQRGILDYVQTLRRSGLVHRTADGHVFASRACHCFLQIVGRTI